MNFKSASKTQTPKSTSPINNSILQRAAVRHITGETERSPEPKKEEALRESNFQQDFSQIPIKNGSPIIQPKLKIGEVGDKYEQEADRLAKEVVSGINAPATPLAQCQKMPDRDQQLQMKPMVQHPPVEDGLAATPDLEASIQRARGGGKALNKSVRSSMERAFGADFSGVRVHTDANSDMLNRSIQARAFTTGQDLFFRQGEYQPESQGGQELLAHELTHVVQQSKGVVRRQQQKQASHSVPITSLASSSVTVQRYLVYNPTNAPAGNINTYNATAPLEAQQATPVPGGGGVGHTFLNAGGNPNIVGDANVPVRISGNGNLAVEDANLSHRQPKHFFADPAKVEEWNKQLAKAGSYFQLIPDTSATITFTLPGTATQKTLVRVKAGNVGYGNMGNQMTIKQACNEVINQVIGSGATTPKLEGNPNIPGPIGQFDEYLADYLTKHLRGDGATTIPGGGLTAANFDDVVDELGRLYGEAINRLANNNATPEDVILDQQLQNFGLNEYAQPEVGEGMYTKSLATIRNIGGQPTVQDYANTRVVSDPASINNKLWQYHWAGVVAKDGNDYITLENYARATEDAGGDLQKDRRFYFQMYGTGTGQSWHEEWTKIGGGGREFANPISMVVKPSQPYGQQYFTPINGGALGTDVNAIKNAHNEVTTAGDIASLRKALLKGLNYANYHIYNSSFKETFTTKARLNQWKNVVANPPAALLPLDAETESLRQYVLQQLNKVRSV